MSSSYASRYAVKSNLTMCCRTTAHRSPSVSLPSNTSAVFGRRVAFPTRAQPIVACRTHSMKVVASMPASVRFLMQGVHLEVTEPVREYAEKKIGNAISHFEDGIREVNVTCTARGGASHQTKGGEIQKIEVTIYSKRGTIHVEDEEGSLYASIDSVSDKVKRALRKLKEKKTAKGWSHAHHNVPKELSD